MEHDETSLDSPPKGLTAIIPCYNAGARLRPVVEAALPRVQRVIVVDDGSSDGAADGLEALGAKVVRLETNRGKGHALLMGIAAALEAEETGAVCLLDADGQHDPAEIPALYETLSREQADLVIGSRVFDGDVPWRSRLGNRITVAVSGRLLGHRLPDTQSGFRMLSRPFAEAVLASVRGGRYETEMEMIVFAVRGGFHIVPVPIRTIYETGNTSSHFRRVRDSFLIYSRLVRALLRHRPSGQG